AVKVEIPSETAARVGEIGAGLGVNTREVLAACWAALIGRICGEQEISVWQVLDGRKYEELSGAVGLYARSVPLRAPLRTGIHFDELLLKLSETWRRAYDFHEYYSDASNGTDLSQPPCQYPVGFEYWNGGWSENHAGITYTLLRQHSCIDRFKVKLSCFD